jgi:hypothetical protein
MAQCAASLPPLFAPTLQQAVRCLLHESAPRIGDEDITTLLRPRPRQESSP